jgi:hypothetical protein
MEEVPENGKELSHSAHGNGTNELTVLEIEMHKVAPKNVYTLYSSISLE